MEEVKMDGWVSKISLKHGRLVVILTQTTMFKGIGKDLNSISVFNSGFGFDEMMLNSDLRFSLS